MQIGSVDLLVPVTVDLFVLLVSRASNWLAMMNHGARRSRKTQGDRDHQFGTTNYLKERPAAITEDARSILLAAVNRVIQIATVTNFPTSTSSGSRQRAKTPPAVVASACGTSLGPTTLWSLNSSASSTPTQSRYGSSHHEPGAGPNGILQRTQQHDESSTSSSTALKHKRLFSHSNFEPLKVIMACTSPVLQERVSLNRRWCLEDQEDLQGPHGRRNAFV